MQYWINVTKNCNLDCLYCYQKEYHESLDLDRLKADQIINFIIYENFENVKIHFYGGEPLLNFGIIQYITEKLLNHKIYYFSITTNLTLLTNEIITFFEKYDFKVLASLDGTCDSQNSGRRTKNGDGTFDLVYQNLKKIISRTEINLRIVKVLSRHNIEYFYQDYLFFKDLHIPCHFNIDYGGMILETDEDLAILKKVFEQVFSDFITLDEKELLIFLNTTFQAFLGLLNGVKLDSNPRRDSCFSVDNLHLAIDYKGYVYPCHYSAEYQNEGNGLSIKLDKNLRKELMEFNKTFYPLTDDEIMILIKKDMQTKRCPECKYQFGCIEGRIGHYRNSCVWRRHLARKELDQISISPKTTICIHKILFEILEEILPGFLEKEKFNGSLANVYNFI